MFKDSWIPKISTFKPICTNMNRINDKVSDFVDNEGNQNKEKLKDSVMAEDYEMIMKIPTNQNLRDNIIWHYDRTKNFRLKVVTNYI